MVLWKRIDVIRLYGKGNKLLPCKDGEGRVSVSTRFADKNVRGKQVQLVGSCLLGKANFREDIKHVLETNSFFATKFFY